MLKKSVNLFGLEISDISIRRAWELARASLLSGERRVFFTPNLEMLEAARKSHQIKSLLNSASVLLPDGVGVLIVSRLLNAPISSKVPGIDFGEGLIALCEREGKSVFLLGGRIGIAKKAAKNLLKKHPRLKICGIHDGYYNEKQEIELVNKIKRAESEVLIVCMGFPRQEKFVVSHQNDFADIKVIACLGGAVDIWSGKKKRAPEFLRRTHLEWAWRTVIEPQRVIRIAKSLPVLAFALGDKFQKTVKNISIKAK